MAILLKEDPDKTTAIKEVKFRNRSLSLKSKEAYEIAVSQFELFCDGEKTAEKLRQYLELVKKQVSPASYNQKRQALKEYLIGMTSDVTKRAIYEEFFKSIPRVKTDKKILTDKYLKPGEVKELLGYLSLRMALLVRVLYQTGCRISEALDLRIEDMKIDQVSQGRLCSMTVRAGKGNQVRTVYLEKSLFSKCKEIFKGKAYLFESRTGKALHRNNVLKQLKRQLKDTRYESISPHVLRHSKAFYLKDRGFDAKQVALALGHSDPATSLRYYYHDSLSASDQLPETDI